MNKLLEKAFADDERGWNERFSKSPDKLAKLARRAQERIAKGEVLPYAPSSRPYEVLCGAKAPEL